MYSHYSTNWHNPWSWLVLGLVVLFWILIALVTGTFYIGRSPGSGISKDKDPNAYWAMIIIFGCLSAVCLIVFVSAQPWGYHLPYK